MTDSTSQQSSLPVVHIKASQGWAPLSLGELWSYREVVYFLTLRELKARYKQTVLGAAWAVLQPIVQMVIFTVIFGRVAKLPSDGIPYPIFSFAALVPWTFFANSVTKASLSLVSGSNMVSRIYFPRLALPLASIMATTLDFALAFLVLLALMVAYGTVPTANVIWLPFLLVLAVATAMGVSFALAALNVQFRDVKHVVPFLIQTWMFATPVVYPASMIKDPFWSVIYALNPMVGVIEGFRWALLGTETAP
ncbi:MAG: ABC transporter permease, partial [Pseudomonadota bacterium]